MIGSIAGAFLAGGPYVTMPIIVGFQQLGAGIPVLVSMITEWSLYGIFKTVIEVGILGHKLTFIRIASSFILAPLSGLLAKLIMKIFKIN